MLGEMYSLLPALRKYYCRGLQFHLPDAGGDEKVRTIFLPNVLIRIRSLNVREELVTGTVAVVLLGLFWLCIVSKAQ
jgi:hypothetical protein